MKNFWLWFAMAIIAFSSCKYDDDALWNKVNSLEERLASLETLLNTMNSDIASMEQVVDALENGKTVSGFEQTTDGYKITFSDGESIEIKNGKDGAAGKDAPIIGVKEENGKYYWTLTLDGVTDWLTGKSGEKIPVSGDAVSGTSGVTPRLKVSADGYWMVSYDNGITYEQVLDENKKPVKAVGEDGVDGSDGPQGPEGPSGTPGDSFFKDVKIENNKLILTLKNGTVLEVACDQKVIDNPFSIIANINDPEIVAIKVDDQGMIHLYGEKDADGVAQGLTSLVFEDVDGKTIIKVDEENRPTFIAVPNGITYQLEWFTSTTGVLKAYEPINNVNISISFDTQQPNGVLQNGDQLKMFNKRSGSSRLELREIADMNYGDLRSAEDNFQKCLVTFQKCDDFYDPNSVYLSVASEKTGVVLAELYDYNKEGTGKYLFDIPSDVYPSIEPDVIIDGIDKVLGVLGPIAQYLTVTGSDLWLCSAISVGLTGLTEGAFAAVAVPFSAGCSAIIKSIAAVNTVNNWGLQPPEGAPTVLQALANAPFIKRIYTDNLILQPIVNGTLSGANGAYGGITPSDNSVIIQVIAEGEPMIQRFYLEPSAPMEGESYFAYATIHCMPIGSKVTMHIEGTDGYADTEEQVMTSANMVAVLDVPGAEKGIFDQVTVSVVTPEGETYNAYASLYFH